MATTIGSKGAQLDLLVRQGGTFGPYKLTLLNPDTSPINLTGATLQAQIKKTPSSLLGDTITASFSYIDRVSGRVNMEFSATDTATLSAGADETSADSQYVWDLEMVDSSSRVIPLLYGQVSVFREVTKV